jgi:serine/threonine-protein kinase RsbW
MSTLRLLAPPADTRQLLTWTVTSSEDLTRIRSGISRYFQGYPGQNAPHGDIDHRIGLIATELAGNALRHGRPPVVVQLLRNDDCYVLDVSDGDPQRAPQAAEPGRSTRAGGRGLLIAGSLAEQVCWYRDKTVKHVWASFRFRQSEPRK